MTKYRVWIHYSKGGDDEYIEYQNLNEALAFSRQKIAGEKHEMPLRVTGKGLLNSKEYNLTKEELKRKIKKKVIGSETPSFEDLVRM